MFAYVGSRTTRERNARGDGISVFRLDERSGMLDPLQVVVDLVNPSYLAVNHAGDRLYTVHGDRSEVSAFRIDGESGQLEFINTRPTLGRNPVHLALDPAGRHLLVTNHLGANLVSVPVRNDGGLGEAVELARFEGTPGPHRIEQTQAKPHFNLFDPSGRFVIVPDKGLDRVFTLRYDADAPLPLAASCSVSREGAGPRHAAFHPARPMLYVVNELDCTVSACDFDAETGHIAPRQILPTLPSNFTGNSRAAGIMVDAHGRFLYASNRGHDSIAVFRIGDADGLLEFVGADTTLGRTPRFFTLSPDATLVFALNEDSDSIFPFRIDAASGRLSPAGPATRCGSPVCMVFTSGPQYKAQPAASATVERLR